MADFLDEINAGEGAPGYVAPVEPVDPVANDSTLADLNTGENAPGYVAPVEPPDEDLVAPPGSVDDIDWSEITNVSEWEDLVRERFPAFAWALDHEELGPLLAEAAEGEYTQETFDAKLRATDWWTGRSAAQRAWDAFEGDPSNAGELDRRLEEKRGEIGDLVGQLGSDLSSEAMAELARSALRLGLSDDEIIGNILSGTTTYSAGTITAAESAVRAFAEGYLISIDAETQRSLSAKLAKGEITQSGLKDFVQRSAKSQYPQFSDMIDRGVNLKEYTAPQRQLIGEMLGRNMQDVDLTSEFRDVLSIGDGSHVRSMSLSETERYIRSKDEYWQGTRGQDETMSLVNGLSKAMGVRR